ncbi:type II secretion system minor pseudopilin GspH, partial [Klebsiella pneumoniae]
APPWTAKAICGTRWSTRARLTLRFPDGQAWTPGEQPDVLIFPGGEVTPFQLRIDAATGINVDAQGDSQPLAAREQP